MLWREWSSIKIRNLLPSNFAITNQQSFGPCASITVTIIDLFFMYCWVDLHLVHAHHAFNFLYIDASYYWLLLTGQVIASLCNLFIWGAGSHLSEVWFPPSERATSTAISAGIAPNVSQYHEICLQSPGHPFLKAWNGPRDAERASNDIVLKIIISN